MTNIVIGGVEKFSAVDFPGTLSAVIFMQGCPWHCPYCHNGSIRSILTETDFCWDLFFEFLKTRVGKLDAVTFSGGEPLAQDCLAEAMAEVKALGYKIGLHTGGYRPEALKKVLPLVSWVGFDIKAPFEANKYAKITGARDLEKVKESLQILLESGVDFECRTTCDPRFLGLEDLWTIAKDLRAKGVKKFFLQKYRPIETDKTSTEEACDALVSDSELLSWCRQNFTEFEVRK